VAPAGVGSGSRTEPVFTPFTVKPEVRNRAREQCAATKEGARRMEFCFHTLPPGEPPEKEDRSRPGTGWPGHSSVAPTKERP